MADGKLNNLLAALREVAADTPDPNDDDSDWNEDDPAADGGDPNDDPRSYYPDATDTDNAEEDEESDFRRRKPLGTVMLLHKLEREAEGRFITELKAENLAIVQRNAKLPPTKQELDHKRLAQLKLKTAQIEDELKLDRQLKLEEKRYAEARMLQRKASLTVADKKAEAESVRQGQITFSTACPEAHPDWRKQVAKEWRSKAVK
jgi:hypothetical protein